MAYSKTVWANDTAPAINADNLNKIEQGIYDATEHVNSLDDNFEQSVKAGVELVLNALSTNVSFSTGRPNTNTGARVTDSKSALSGYVACGNTFFSLNTNDYYFRIMFTRTNSNSSGNVLFVTDWHKGTEKAVLLYDGAAYCKIQVVTDISEPGEMTNLISDVYSKETFYGYTKVFVDDSLKQSGYAADAKVTGDEIFEIKETNGNLFYVTEELENHNGVTLVKNADASFTLTGTSTKQFLVGIMGAPQELVESSSSYAAVIPAGKYTVRFRSLTGPETRTSNASIGIRYTCGEVSDELLVNGSTANQIITFEEDARVWMRVGLNQVFTGWTVFIQFEPGEVKSCGTTSNEPAIKTAVDGIAREGIDSVIKTIGYISDKRAEMNQSVLNEHGRLAVSELIKAHGRMLTCSVITDTHAWNNDIAPFSFSFKNCLNLFVKTLEYTDFGAHCGDVVESGDMIRLGATTDYVTYEDHVKYGALVADSLNGSKKPVYVIQGNHDRNDTRCPAAIKEDMRFTDEEFDLTFHRYAGDVETNPDDMFGNYYYKDYPEYKIRVLVVADFRAEEEGTDRLVMDEEQIAWLTNTALMFDDYEDKSEWGLLIFSHYYNWYNAKSILKNFIKGESTFEEQGPIPIIANIHGHSHEQEYESVNLLDSGYGFNAIGIDQAFLKAPGTENAPVGGSDNSFIGELTEYCLSLFCIDTENHIIYETGIGRRGDRTFHYGTTVEENYQLLTT